MKLTAQGNRDNGTRVETIEITGSLEEILKEVETYMGRNDQHYTAPFENGHVWFDDRETGFDEEGGENAVPFYEYGEEEPPYYIHSTPRPITIDGVETYARGILDVHSVSIEE